MATKIKRIKLLKRVRKDERSIALWQLEDFARNAKTLNKAIVTLILCGLSRTEAREIATHVRTHK